MEIPWNPNGNFHVYLPTEIPRYETWTTILQDRQICIYSVRND